MERYLASFRASEAIPGDMFDTFVCCVARGTASELKLRMYGVYADQYGVRCELRFNVVRTIGQAVDWLTEAADLEACPADAKQFFADTAPPPPDGSGTFP